LHAALADVGDDFPGYLANRPGGPWEHADCPELAGLEAWGTELAARDRRAGVGALVRVAQHGLPIILERAGIGLDGMGFKADEPHADGAPVERQVQLAAAWVDEPSAAHLAAVRAGNDPARQLAIWDEDLRPNDDRAHWWYLDVGQCCGHAITRPVGGGDAHAPSYYGWPAEVCVGRGLVICVRGLRCRGARVREILAELYAVLAR
jgi:hypothetical protein